METGTQTHETVNQVAGHYFPGQPFLGSTVTVILLAVGLLLGEVKRVDNMHIPPIIIESLQVMALSGSVVVAIITIIGFIRRTGRERAKKGNSDEK